uniref:Uncharacterized protein n=2 Tax=Micrurus TaxID=8634 RepID=A0A2D4H4S6_MICCO
MYTYFALTSKKTADNNSNTLVSCHSIPSCSVFRSIQFSGCSGKSPPCDFLPLNVNGNFLHRCPEFVLCIESLPAYLYEDTMVSLRNDPDLDLRIKAWKQ